MTTGLMDREMAKAKLRAEAALAVGWNLNEQRINAIARIIDAIFAPELTEARAALEEPEPGEWSYSVVDNDAEDIEGDELRRFTYWTWEVFDTASEEIVLDGSALDDPTEVVRQIVADHNRLRTQS